MFFVLHFIVQLLIINDWNMPDIKNQKCHNKEVKRNWMIADVTIEFFFKKCIHIFEAISPLSWFDPKLGGKLH